MASRLSARTSSPHMDSKEQDPLLAGPSDSSKVCHCSDPLHAFAPLPYPACLGRCAAQKHLPATRPLHSCQLPSLAVRTWLTPSSPPGFWQYTRKQHTQAKWQPCAQAGYYRDPESLEEVPLVPGMSKAENMLRWGFIRCRPCCLPARLADGAHSSWCQSHLWLRCGTLQLVS